MFDFLNPARWLLWIAAAGALVAGGYALVDHIGDLREVKVTARYETALAKQKAEAAKALAAAASDLAKSQAQLSALKSQLEKSREELQSKNAAALRTRLAGPRLQFTAEAGCRDSSDATKGSAASATGDAAAAVVQLPEPLNGNLLQFGADAQSLAIDYGILFEFVNNPKVVCEMRDAAVQ